MSPLVEGLLINGGVVGVTVLVAYAANEIFLSRAQRTLETDEAKRRLAEENRMRTAKRREHDFQMSRIKKLGRE